MIEVGELEEKMVNLSDSLLRAEKLAVKMVVKMAADWAA